MKNTFSSLCLCLTLLFLLVSCSGASAHIASLPEPAAEFYVYDEANVLTETTKSHIITQNDSLFSQTGAQIVIVCVRTTGTSSMEDFAHQLFNQWEIGSSDKNNGILLLLSIEEEDYWCLTGRGLENTLGSGTVKLMLNQYLEPDFAASAYDAGVRSLFDALIAHLETLYSVSVDGSTPPAEAPNEEPLYPQETDEGPSILAWAVIIVIIILLIISFTGNGSGPRRQHRRTVYTTPRTRTYRYGTQMPPVTRPAPPRPGSSYGGPRPGGSYGGSRPGSSYGGSRPGSSYGGSRPGGSYGGSRPGGMSRGGGGGMSRGGGAGRR